MLSCPRFGGTDNEQIDNLSSSSSSLESLHPHLRSRLIQRARRARGQLAVSGDLDKLRLRIPPPFPWTSAILQPFVPAYDAEDAMQIYNHNYQKLYPQSTPTYYFCEVIDEETGAVGFRAETDLYFTKSNEPICLQAKGLGRSKKEAKSNAAQDMLRQLSLHHAMQVPCHYIRCAAAEPSDSVANGNIPLPHGLPASNGPRRRQHPIKKLLADLVMKHFGIKPVYVDLGSSGPSYHLTFHCSVSLPCLYDSQIGVGGSKKAAQQNAAELLYAVIQKDITIRSAQGIPTALQHFPSTGLTALALATTPSTAPSTVGGNSISTSGRYRSHSDSGSNGSSLGSIDNYHHYDNYPILTNPVSPLLKIPFSSYDMILSPFHNDDNERSDAVRKSDVTGGSPMPMHNGIITSSELLRWNALRKMQQPIGKVGNGNGSNGNSPSPSSPSESSSSAGSPGSDVFMPTTKDALSAPGTILYPFNPNNAPYSPAELFTDNKADNDAALLALASAIPVDPAVFISFPDLLPALQRLHLQTLMQGGYQQSSH